MGALFGSKPAGLKTKYSGIRTTASVFGIPIPLIYGKQRVAGKVIWFGDFIASKDKNAGKKGGGKGFGKSSGGWVYTTAVQELLCQGNVSGIDNVWDSIGKFAVADSAQSFIISLGVFLPVNADTFANDAGVGQTINYSVVASDFGAPGPVTLTGTYTSPFVRVTGTPLSGQYKVDPATGAYTFSSADVGKTVTVYYTYYSFQTIQTELTVIPFSPPYTYTVEHQPYFGGDKGVFYYPSGTALTAGLGGTGTYNANGGSYVFSAADAGKAIVVTYQYNQVNKDRNAPNTLNMTFFSGGRGQAPWSYMTSKHPGQALGYSDTCYMASSALYLGYSPTIPHYNYEIVGLYPVGAGIQDANPADVIQSLLTDTGFGAGFNPNNLSYTLQSPARSYWAANNFFVSLVLEHQASAGTIIGELLEASQVGAYWSEGLLKFVPYGSTTTIDNGYVFNPKTSPVVSLGDGDYVPSRGEEPVKVSRKPWEDAYNKVGVRWTVRTNSYNEDVLEAEDPAAIDTFGLRREPPVSYPFICTEKAAQFAANLRVQRSTSIRNAYSFNLKSNYAYLEPMDIVLLTDSNLSLSNTPVRIVNITDAPDKPLAVVAEDFPWSIGDAVLYPKQVQQPSDDLSRGQQDPGNTDIFVFEAPSTLSLQQGNSLYIFVGGKELAWGGANIWISFDNITYNLLTTTSVSGRFGTLTSPFYSGPDPDNTQVLYVNLENSNTILSSVTQTDADHFVTRSILAAPNILLPTYVESPATLGYNIALGHGIPTAGTWTNPSKFIDVSPSVGASQSLTASATSGWGAVSTFGFNFSASATITGLQVFFDAQVDLSPAINQSSDAIAVQLVDQNGNVSGTSKVIPLRSPYTIFQQYTAGGPISIPLDWGLSFITNTIVNNSNFGFSIQAIAAGLASPTVFNVRGARMRIFTGTAQAPPELISYQTASLVGDHIYKLGYLRRGIENTTIQNWPTGSFFGRLDQASYVYQYPASYVGKTAYMKATSFNIFGNQQQSLASVSAVVVPLIGVPGATDVGSGASTTGAGAVPPAWSGPFTYTADDGIITWKWNIIVKRNDGTTQRFIGTQTITGLTIGLTYYFYPYIDDSKGISKATLNFVAGSQEGTPAWAFTTAEKSNTLLQQASTGNHLPLASAPISAIASAGGSGGGGGAGCFTGNVRIQTVDFGVVRFDELPIDKDFLIENECGIFFARLLVHENHISEMLDMGRGELVTANHLVKSGEKWICAEHYFYTLSQRTVCTTVYNLQVLTRDEEARHYILENGIVAHNLKMA